MAELSDIDTSQVGLIAYWNALDHGVSSIDPTEVTANANITGYTQYDNGLEGTITFRQRDNWNFRVKTDGWFVIWTDRSNHFDYRSSDHDDFRGYYNLCHNHMRDSGKAALPRSDPSDIINALRQELSNSASITFNHGDVGYYNYEYPDATTISVFSMHIDRDESKSGDISFTDQTTIYYHVALAASNGYSSSNKTSFSWDGISLAGGTSRVTSARDIIANGDMTPGSAVSWSGGGDTNSANWISYSQIAFWA